MMSKAYKCNICKNFFEGHPYAKINIRLQQVDPRDGQSDFSIESCKKCCEPLLKED